MVVLTALFPPFFLFSFVSDDPPPSPPPPPPPSNLSDSPLPPLFFPPDEDDDAAAARRPSFSPALICRRRNVGTSRCVVDFLMTSHPSWENKKNRGEWLGTYCTYVTSSVNAFFCCQSTIIVSRSSVVLADVIVKKTDCNTDPHTHILVLQLLSTFNIANNTRNAYQSNDIRHDRPV